jgi:hypothetical protein
VVDQSGSPYAKLILMAGPEGSKQIALSWDNALSIDNTNNLTYVYDQPGSTELFEQQENMPSRKNMQLSRKLQAGESVTIYFFKEDAKKSYAQSKRIMTEEAPTGEINGEIRAWIVKPESTD